MLSGFEDCFKSWELPRLFTLRNLIPGAENCGRETDVQVTEKSTPLVLKLTEDLPDGPYKTYYNLVFNYAMLFYLAIYTISILIPRDFLGNYDLTFIGHYIPKLKFEINFSQIRYAEKLNSYLLSYFLMLSATVPVVFLMAFYGILNGRRHPFSNAQKRQFKKWHIVSPLLLSTLFLFIIPLPVWLEGKRSELFRDPLLMPIVNFVFFSIAVAVSAAGFLAIGRLHAKHS